MSGDESSVGKGCCQSMQSSTSREFLLDSLSSFQERRSVEASRKPQETGQMGDTPALQNGIIDTKRLDGEDSPQRFILHNFNTSMH